MFRAVHEQRDRGSAPVETAITGLVAVAFITLLIVGGRIAITGQVITGVAGTAARQASLMRTPAAAAQTATSTAVADLAAAHLHCDPAPVITVNTTGYTAPPGLPAVVTVDVNCRVSLADLGGLPGLPGHRLLHDRAVSPLDPYRSRP